MKKYMVPFVVMMALNSCDSLPSLPAGGPCSFKTDSSSLQLIKLIPNTDSSQFDAQFQFSETNLKGTQVFNFSLVNHRQLNAVEVRQNNWGPGSKAVLIQLIPVSGNCGGGDSILIYP